MNAPQDAPDKKSRSHIDRARRAAERLLQEQERLVEFIDKVRTKAHQQKGQLGGFWDDLHLLIRLVGAYRSGQYRQIPWKSLLMIVTALVYFLNPIDLVPDFLGILGYADDATVIGMVITAVKDDLDRFRAFLEAGESFSDLQQEKFGNSGANS